MWQRLIILNVAKPDFYLPIYLSRRCNFQPYYPVKSTNVFVAIGVSFNITHKFIIVKCLYHAIDVYWFVFVVIFCNFVRHLKHKRNDFKRPLTIFIIIVLITVSANSNHCAHSAFCIVSFLRQRIFFREEKNCVLFNIKEDASSMRQWRLGKKRDKKNATV